MSSMPSGFEDAIAAITQVTALFRSRCQAAVKALESNDMKAFDQSFKLQQVAWLNLDAMLGKFEAGFGDYLGAVDPGRTKVRNWVLSCQSAALELQQKISVKLSEIEAQGRTAGKLKQHLAAFQSARREESLFLKGA